MLLERIVNHPASSCLVMFVETGELCARKTLNSITKLFLKAVVYSVHIPSRMRRDYGSSRRLIEAVRVCCSRRNTDCFHSDTGKKVVNQQLNNERKIMSDPTEPIRREMVAQLNSIEGSREYFESKYGEVFDTSQLQQEFEVIAFLCPFVSVRRRSDNLKGSVMFQHSPRFYFQFQPE